MPSPLLAMRSGHDRTASSFLRPLVLAALALVTVGCSGWQRDRRPVTEIVRVDAPRELRLRRTDGSLVTLSRPRLVRDSLQTTFAGSDSTAGGLDTLVAGSLLERRLATGEIARGGGRRNAVVLLRASEISAVEVLRPSRARTWAAVGVGVAFIALVVLVGPYGSGSDY